jgi:hypothetical protein
VILHLLSRAHLSISFCFTEQFDHRRIAMIEEEARPSIELPDRLYIFLGQLKIKYVEVLRHSVLSNRFGYDDDVPLRLPSEDDLRDRLAQSL